MAQDLGYRDYKHYLCSDQWKAIRDRVLEERGSQCSCCTKESVSVHHQFYSVSILRGECTRYLWPICDDCHVKVHHNRDGKFIDCFGSSTKLLKMISDKNRPAKKRRKKRKRRTRNRFFELEEQNEEIDNLDLAFLSIGLYEG